MSNQRDLNNQIHRLSDIGDIMTAMKNLAFMETRKLERYLHAQTRIVQQIKQSAQVSCSHYPDALPSGKPHQHLCLLIGSERGFCGDFNQRLAQQTEVRLQQLQPKWLVIIGHRLNQHPLNGVETLALLSGANATEEVETVLINVTRQLADIEQQHGPFQLSVLFNHPDSNQLSKQELLPPFREFERSRASGATPVLNLNPEKLLLGLGEHYLFACLQQLLYLSLMAENQLRIAHLQGAIKKLEQQLLELQRGVNRMRQEAIVEEIEIILINQNNLETPIPADQ